MVLILIGKAAVGKDTILKQLVKQYNFIPIISDTTRPTREGEVDGVDYNFISLDEFRKRSYIETRVYKTTVDNKPVSWYYGCPVDDYSNNNKNFVAVFDTAGTREFMDAVGDHNVKVIQVLAPDDIRRKRAEERGSFDADEWENRLKDDGVRFCAKRVSSLNAESVINNNGFLQDTVDKIYKIYSASKTI